MSDTLLSFLRIILLELVTLFGVFFVLGFLLSKLQQATQANYRRTIGWKGILLTAWIGTPIHEIGHIFFAKLFRHKVTHISLFKPDEETGNLGHVEHTYNRLSLYQRIGNFFIGAAPMIAGSVILLTLSFFLVPNARDIYALLGQQQSAIVGMISIMAQTIVLLFSPINLQSTEFWIFLFLSFCISAHIAPSKQDQKEMWGGLLSFVVLLALLNIIPVLLKADPLRYVAQISVYFNFFTSVFLYALIISLIHYSASWIFLVGPTRLLKKLM